MPPRSALPADQLVTSSNLVRHFGLWQERAARSPLYILHRGRPRFVMTSIETMDALCSQPVTPSPSVSDSVGEPIDAAALLDGIGDLVLLADADRAIIGASSRARTHFGLLAAHGARIDEIAPFATRAFLADAIQRVLDSAAPDWIEIPSAARPGRTLAITITAASHGIILFCRDITTDEELRALQSAAQAQHAAMIAVGNVAVATVNPRGYLVAPDKTLAALCGLSVEALSAIRFITLAEIGARVALGEAIEAVMAGHAPTALDARLLVNRADPVAVRIGLSPLRGARGAEGVSAVIVAAQAQEPRTIDE